MSSANQKPAYVIHGVDLSNHTCTMTVIACVDFRFRGLDQEFIENHFSVDSFDLFKWPGGAKDIRIKSWSDLFKMYIRKISIDSHQAEKVVILSHWDCGGYGGSKSFASDEDQEARYIEDLKHAKKILAEALPDSVEIILAYSRLMDQELCYFIVD